MNLGELRQLTTLLDRSVDAAVFLDAELRIRYFNEAYLQLSGTRRRVLEAAPVCHETMPLEICQSACAVRRCNAMGRGVRLDEITASPKGSESRTVIVVASPLLDDHGERIGAVEIYRDVTAEARVQAHYKVLLERAQTEQERLEAEVGARTEALRQAQAQLVHQEKMSSLGRLVAGITHELNNPLNFVSGNLAFFETYASALLAIVDAFAAGDATEGARLMKQADYGYLHADLPKLLASVRGGIGRAIAIVANLRSFSYFGHGGVAEADLDKCVRSTVEIVEPSLRGRVEVHCALSGLPKVLCNAAHMNQVFLNLVSNAADAIVGPGRIDVTGRAVGDHVEIQVADTGAGIPPEVLPKIFEPFFSTKPLGEGTGLGLSISYGIVRDHGGTITAEPRSGGGTIFTVRLPIRGPKG